MYVNTIGFVKKSGIVSLLFLTECFWIDLKLISLP